MKGHVLPFLLPLEGAGIEKLFSRLAAPLARGTVSLSLSDPPPIPFWALNLYSLKPVWTCRWMEFPEKILMAFPEEILVVPPISTRLF